MDVLPNLYNSRALKVLEEDWNGTYFVYPSIFFFLSLFDVFSGRQYYPSSHFPRIPDPVAQTLGKCQADRVAP